jgi:hypothetical protein
MNTSSLFTILIIFSLPVSYQGILGVDQFSNNTNNTKNTNKQQPFKQRRAHLWWGGQKKRSELLFSEYSSPTAQQTRTHTTMTTVTSLLTMDATSPLLGLWELDETMSESLSPFLIACGAPSFISPMFAKALNRLRAWIQREDNNSLSITYQQRGLRIPIKLQTDASYLLDGSNVKIGTPRGPQQGRIVSIDEEDSISAVKVVRDGPAVNERVEEEWTFDSATKVLVLNLLHVSHKKLQKETRVKRIYHRVQEDNA